MGSSSFFNDPTDYTVVDEGGDGSGFYDGPAYTAIDPVAINNSVAEAAASAAAAAASAAAAEAALAVDPSDALPLMDGTAAPGTGVDYSRSDHVHPTDTSRADAAATTAALALKADASALALKADDAATTAALALKAPLASPALTGNPTAPTQSAGNNSTRLATTAYVDTADALKAPLASPTFTGTPAAPTAAVGTNTTQVATTAFVKAAFAATLATSGYQKLPSGLIIQWGLSAGTGDDAVTFPIAFPTACLGVSATLQYTPTVGVMAVATAASASTTGCSVFGRYTSGGAVGVAAVAIRWLSWGY